MQIEKARSTRGKSKTQSHRKAVKPQIKLKLWLQSGGLCSFAGCAQKLSEHSLTYEEANFSNIAHIVAYEKDGPRGDHPLPLENRNDYENLMLVCTECHKLIDDKQHVSKYSVETLQKYKREHEEKLQFVLNTFFKGERTQLIRCQANIGSETVQIPMKQMADAIAPQYAALNGPFIDIDLTKTHGTDNRTYWESKREEIGNLIKNKIGPGESAVEHLSVFAMGPMPLLMHLGNCLSNKIKTAIYQRHRDTETWSWKSDGPGYSFYYKKITDGNHNEVAVILSLSGKVNPANLPEDISKTMTIYEVSLNDVAPSPTFLSNLKTLENFRKFYRELISSLSSAHPGLTKLHVFPAVPAPIAVLCGRELLQKVDPTLAVYDYNKNNGIFEFALEVNNEHK